MNKQRQVTDLFQYNNISFFTKFNWILFSVEILTSFFFIFLESIPYLIITISSTFQYLCVIMQIVILVFVRKKFVTKTLDKIIKIAPQNYSYPIKPLIAFVVLHAISFIASFVIILIDSSFSGILLLVYIFGLLYAIAFARLKKQFYL